MKTWLYDFHQEQRVHVNLLTQIVIHKLWKASLQSGSSMILGQVPLEQRFCMTRHITNLPTFRQRLATSPELFQPVQPRCSPEDYVYSCAVLLCSDSIVQPEQTNIKHRCIIGNRFKLTQPRMSKQKRWHELLIIVHIYREFIYVHLIHI